MSTTGKLDPGARRRRKPEPPFIGALLRLTWLRVRERLHQAIREAGYSDLQDAHFAVFSYPLPHGVRPSDLARNIRMSRQATNHLIGQLEALGYLERRAGAGSERRLIYLSARGVAVGETIYACLIRLQDEWSAEIGCERFEVFMDVLRELSREPEAA